MTAQCAQCWRLYEATADGVRRHQMLADPPHRPTPLDKGDARVVAAAVNRAEREGD